MTGSSARPTRLRVRIGRAALGAADRARLSALRWQGFASRWVETERGPIHMLESSGDGIGPPLVLLHGLSSCALDFGPVLRYLRPHTRRLLVPDLPGHGLSTQLDDANDIEQARLTLHEALDAVLDEPAVVFGNSLGGFAGIRYANASAARVRGLILSSPGGAPVSRGQLDELLDQFRPSDLDAARAFIRRVSARPHWSHPVLAWAAQLRFQQPGVQDLLRLASTDDLLRPTELAGLEMPVLLLWGREEKLFGATEHDFFRKHLPRHAVLEEPDGFGHAPFLDHPRALAERIQRFAHGVG